MLLVGPPLIEGKEQGFGAKVWLSRLVRGGAGDIGGIWSERGDFSELFLKCNVDFSKFSGAGLAKVFLGVGWGLMLK